MPLAEDVDLDSLARRTERFTGADLEDLVRRAGLCALRQSLDVRQVTMDHFEEALKDTRASVTPEMEKDYESIQGQLKQNALTMTPIGFVAPGMLTPRESSKGNSSSHIGKPRLRRRTEHRIAADFLPLIVRTEGVG